MFKLLIFGCIIWGCLSHASPTTKRRMLYPGLDSPWLAKYYVIAPEDEPVRAGILKISKKYAEALRKKWGEESLNSYREEWKDSADPKTEEITEGLQSIWSRKKVSAIRQFRMGKYSPSRDFFSFRCFGFQDVVQREFAEAIQMARVNRTLPVKFPRSGLAASYDLENTVEQIGEWSADVGLLRDQKDSLTEGELSDLATAYILSRGPSVIEARTVQSYLGLKENWRQLARNTPNGDSTDLFAKKEAQSAVRLKVEAEVADKLNLDPNSSEVVNEANKQLEKDPEYLKAEKSFEQTQSNYVGEQDKAYSKLWIGLYRDHAYKKRIDKLLGGTSLKNFLENSRDKQLETNKNEARR